MASASQTPAQSSIWTKVDKEAIKAKLLKDVGLEDPPHVEEAPEAKLMENLSLQDLPPAGGPNHVQPPPVAPPPVAPPQLPPQVRDTLVDVVLETY